MNKVLEAARLAPTAANRQSFKVFVIKTSGLKDELKKIYSREWFSQPPYRRDGKNYVDVDAAIVMDHIILAAADLGLGTCWIGAFDPNAAREFLELPENMEPIVFTPLGYPADSPDSKIRKPIDEIVVYKN